MLEDQVAFLLQKYLGNYVRGLNKEALKISVWRGDVELTNMQLRPEALNALKLPVKVKAGFLGSVRLKVPWSRLGQEPVLVYLDRILILAEPATQVEGSSEDAVQEAKKLRVRELEMRLLESQQQLKSEMNTSWLGSLISTIIGNLKLSITNIHIRYEDLESNPGHPFAAGVTLARLSAVTIDDYGKETFATGGALARIQKSVELERLALYFDSDVHPWNVEKPWEELRPSEWSQIFELESKNGKSINSLYKEHSYVLQPVTGNARYTKLRLDESRTTGQALQQAAVNLDSVTLCIAKDGYRDILKLADNFAAFNQRLKYAHYRPRVSVKSDPRAWWKYACKVVTDEVKKASGKLSWEQVLRYARLRKRYVSLYASLLKADSSRLVVDDNKEIDNLDRDLDIEVILQWRMLAHKFVEQSADSDLYINKQKTKSSWWSFGRTGSSKDESESRGFTEEDWERLNNIIGYKEDSNDQLFMKDDKGDLLHFCLEIHMKHNASKLLIEDQQCLADLSCEGLDCSIKSYSEAKVFNLKLASYRLLSPYGLLAESASASDSLVGIFSYKPFDAQVDWSFIAKASPCYMTYLKDSIDQIAAFFKSGTTVSQTLAMETAAAVQMTIDGVKRTAQQQVSRALKDHSRFFLDLDIAAPKITIPTDFCPDGSHATRLLLDLGNLMLTTQDYWECDSSEEKDMYLQFNLVLSDVSAFLVDGDYCWNETPPLEALSPHNSTFLPVIEKCGVVVKLQQIQSENPFYPSTRLAVRLPSLGFHFSPARYHRLMQVAKIFENENGVDPNMLRPWDQADFEGWLYLLAWKGVGNREAVWQRRYVCLVGPYLYILERPASKAYKQYLSLRGKQVHQVPTEFTGGAENVLAISDVGQSNTKVVEDINALILRSDTNESRRAWQNRLQGAIYRASGSSAITTFSDISYSTEATRTKSFDYSAMRYLVNIEKLFLTGVLDELRICFSCSYPSNRSFKKILLGKESRLMEFRAIGGQVELSIKANNILIGTVLKSLEIEDQFCSGRRSKPQYLARSFIGNTEATTSDRSLSFDQQNYSNQLSQADSDDKFFEASDKLDDMSDQVQRQGSISEYFSSECSFLSTKPSMRPPDFSRISGLIPDAELQTRSITLETFDDLDSFVKAQIVIYSQDSPLYSNLDNRVVVTLATLSFFCHRPTIMGILEFANAINIEVEHSDTDEHNVNSSSSMTNAAEGDPNDQPDSAIFQEPLVKGLLDKGKTRIIFYLTLNMAKAQIFLMNENGTSLATLSQNDLLADIKVFPSSFSIKAALGNLKISDDSLPSSHSYFWMCDMRDPGGSSFIELDFSSFNMGDEDYEGYDYSLIGQLSEVRIVYLNRFVQEVVSYFMGLVPTNTQSVVKLKDHVTNSEKWVTTNEIEGSPAVKIDLSLRKPIILMPKRTESMDYLQLDVPHITVQNTFKWLGGEKNEMTSVHLEIMTIKIKDINLTIGTSAVCGESIIQDVKGLSVVIKRALRDPLHQIPTTEAVIKIEMLKAALSNGEYEIVTECALSNISETPHTVPTLDQGLAAVSSDDTTTVEPQVSPASSTDASSREERGTWVTMRVLVAIDLVELSLHSGITRDSSLASVQASGAWLLYNANTCGEGFLFATLKGISVFDDREGIQQEFRLAVGRSGTVGYTTNHPADEDIGHMIDSGEKKSGYEPIPSMLILDAKFGGSLTNISLCIQRPKMLVALDFLLAVVEFFVPSVRSMISNDEDDQPLHILGAIIIDNPVYNQPSSEFILSPQRPLVVDDERFDHFVYDGKGGKLYLQDREGRNLSDPCSEAIIYVGNGKRLQFKNVTVMNGEYLDSCIYLGTNSSYSASRDDSVFLEGRNNAATFDSQEDNIEPVVRNVVDGSTELVIELQAVGPELTFYSALKDFDESLALSNKVMHANLDVFCRLVMKGDSFEMSGNVLGLKVESNGIRVLEPFDGSLKFSNAFGKTNINFAISDIFMNLTFSILRLFIAVEEDILAFLRMTSNKVSVTCSQFDKIGTIQNFQKDQIYAFWRPRAPAGFAILGDCLTPLNEPPSRGVRAVNISYARVKKPVSFKLIWPCSPSRKKGHHGSISIFSDSDEIEGESTCSVWFPVAPKGYVAVGCVVSAGKEPPPLSSALCILASLVSPSTLKDCIALDLTEPYSIDIAFWRVENSFGSFLPANPNDMSLDGKAYELRHMIFEHSEHPTVVSKNIKYQDTPQINDHGLQLERSAFLNSGRLFEAVASFRLIWWNQGTASRKKLSIWRPVVPHGMVFLGDVAVQGYEPPNLAIVLHDTEDKDILKDPQDFQLVGHIRKQKRVDSISFWLPQAPPGYVGLGCIASKGYPKHDDFSSLRCIRSDMVTGDSFPEESIWDSSDTKSTEPFSLWSVGNEVGTFLVRSGFKKPPKRFALKLAGTNVSSSSDNTVIDAEIKTFSAAVFDDYGGLTVPLFNASLSSIGLNLHGRPAYLNCTVSFSLTARSYNDKYDSWEPLVEPTDGFLRYQYDLNAPGAATQLRMTSTRDLNVNASVSNANMMFQAYSSWSNCSDVNESHKKEAVSPIYSEKSIIDVHHRKNYYIIPQNNLGQDIFIRPTEGRRFSNIIKMPSGDNKPVKVPVSKNMLDSHVKGKVGRVSRSMVTVIISDAELASCEGLTSDLYTMAVRLCSSHPSDSPLQQQSARTSGVVSVYSSISGMAVVNWSEAFYFKVDSSDDYIVEFIVVEMGKGDPVGIFSSPLKQIAFEVHPFSNSDVELEWRELSPPKKMEHQNYVNKASHGRIKCAVLLSDRSEFRRDKQDITSGKPGYIQISPTKEGPWTTVRLNYAAPAACWRLGNDVVASEVHVKDGNRYVSIRSLVSVTNNTDFDIDLHLKSKDFNETLNLDDGDPGDKRSDNNRIETDEFFEKEEYTPSVGWTSCSPCLPFAIQIDQASPKDKHQHISDNQSPDGWEWIDNWHVDKTSVNTADGWVYASDVEHLKWPESSDYSHSISQARQRRWIRQRRYVPYDDEKRISIELLKPGNSVPLPLSSLSHPILSYVLQLRPRGVNEPNFYSWSVVLQKHDRNEVYSENVDSSEISVSALNESDALLYCSQINGSSSSKNAQGLWFCLSIRATEIGKDIHLEPIQDWNITIDSPLSITNFLPFSAEYTVIDKQLIGQNITCSEGSFSSGETKKIYNADLRHPLYLSVLPQGGWEQLNEPVPISDPGRIPSKMLSLRSSFSGRIVQVIIEQNYQKDQLAARVVRIYVPYWIASARCPPLTYSLVDMSGRRESRKFPFAFHSNQRSENIIWKITEEEMVAGYTILSVVNFKRLGFSASINRPDKECFGPSRDLSPLGDMDGSVDLYAYDGDGNCIRIFLSSKPSCFQAVPTKVISIRPFMIFTNRVGQDIYIKFNASDNPKILRAADSRVSYVYREVGEPERLQVRLEDTEWCFPVEVVQEDVITLVLRNHHGERRYLKAEIRGYEDGSRFLVVFRLASGDGPIRIENRIADRSISIRQSGFHDDSWIRLEPLSTTKFSWNDPYGQRLVDIGIHSETVAYIQDVSLEKSTDAPSHLREQGIQLNVAQVGDILIVRFVNDRRTTQLGSHESGEIRFNDRNNSSMQRLESSTAPLEVILELGVVGISLIDHKPRELLYLYVEKVFISYSTGYDAGTTSRFKLIIGELQLDNQLPLTIMPVILAPEDMPDTNHPVFKATVTMNNKNADGAEVYPYVYVRVTEKCWRLNIHEPIIWALVDLYNNLRIDSIPSSSSVTQVDPEIRIDLIDISEIRLKISLETEPTQRPHGVLGIWSPVLSAIGNAFKIQVHLRKVMHKSRFMRKSSIIPAVLNRVRRDLIHNPLHLIFSVDLLGMTKSTLASLSKGFAELSTDGQFLQLRTKQVWSRRITGFSDGILQGTEAFAQGVAFGVSGVLKKPVESARQQGLVGFARGLGHAFVGFVVQPLSGALDFVSLTVDGIGASCARCLEILNNKTILQRIRNPRAIHANGLLKEYSEKEAAGQMALFLAEEGRHLGCTDLFKEPSKYAWSDYYADHFVVPYQRVVLITNKRVMLLQCLDLDKMDKKPSKIIWDVPWEELLALELAKAGHPKPSHLIIHLKNFRRSESFVRLIKCSIEEDEDQQPQAVRICSSIRKMWKSYQSDMKFLTLKVPSSQRHVQFAWDEVDGRESYNRIKPIIKSRGLTAEGSISGERKFIKHTVNFQKIWSSEQECRSRCTLFPKQVVDDGAICSIWRPVCPDGYVSIGDIAHAGIHQPNVAAVFRDCGGNFTTPVGYDLVWRNCAEDYATPLSIWLPRPPDGFVALGCVALAGYEEPPQDTVYCVRTGMSEETSFEEQIVWTAPDSYPWACYIYQVQSEALQFIALRLPKEESDWRPKRVSDRQPPQVPEVTTEEGDGTRT